MCAKALNALGLWSSWQLGWEHLDLPDPPMTDDLDGVSALEWGLQIQDLLGSACHSLRPTPGPLFRRHLGQNRDRVQPWQLGVPGCGLLASGILV